MARIERYDAKADLKRREDIKAALEAGAFKPGAACRLLRKLHGLSQADLAAMLGVNLKVIRSIESGLGNPSFASVEKLGDAFGLDMVFIKKGAAAELLDVAARIQEKARSRAADARALAIGFVSESELNKKNALRVGRADIKE
jgi:transcriptional regulator with XRE-family HTH domain